MTSTNAHRIKHANARKATARQTYILTHSHSDERICEKPI